ncbi:hypothetical protein N7457_003409 [Penicillium paradoxum]|uniref:uncharacterized protein n=1 Tax=Penicillium paradoxum TaxID=176176 RepID=UPI0025474459|nr:uncharacterized protein N7457_003409 [Penicillium paradoxum]KAJ5788419.1 hypothetical protein N7457_003409 [Penicillium paradoxum]
MALSPEDLVNGFRTINDNGSRRAVLHEIMSSLSFGEKREVKSWAKSLKFQCDVFAKLPVELAALLAQYFNLSDIFVLRRVSKRWHDLLTSTTVLGAAIRNRVGKDVVKSPSSLVVLEVLIKKIIRAERGMPAVVALFPQDLPPYLWEDINRDAINYCKGVCAWIEGSTERTSIFLVHLKNGSSCKFTTENRERLTHINVSDTLVSATSIQGYCHVWKILTGEHKCFRIPRVDFLECVSCGPKVLLSYRDTIVHFNFDTGITHSVNTGPTIISVSAHPVKDEFSVICIRRKHRSEGFTDGHSLEWEEQDLRSKRYSIRDNEFVCIWEQTHELPLKTDNGWWLGTGPWGERAHRESLYPGQSAAVMNGGGPDKPSLSLVLEDDGQITVHFLLSAKELMGRLTNLDYSDQGSRLIYCAATEDASSGYRLYIGSEHSDSSPICPDNKAFRFRTNFELELPDCPDCIGTVGDEDFIIFYSEVGETVVWSFDETWVPSGIPGIRAVSR